MYLERVEQEQGFNISRYTDNKTKHRGYRFLYCLSTRKGDHPRFIGAYTLQEADTFIIFKEKILVTRDTGKPEEIKLNANYSYYITPNPMIRVIDKVTGKKGVRKEANLRGLDSIVIDLDIRGDNANYKAIAERLTEVLYKSLFNRGVINEPNKVIFTGRGIHLWWYFNQVGKNQEQAYMSVINAIQHEIDVIVNNHYEFTGVKVDSAVSKRMWGLVRLAGVNQASKLAVECLRESNEQYTLEELASTLDLTNVTEVLDKETIVTTKTPKGIQTAVTGSTKEMLYARVRTVENVINESIKTNTYIGKRRDMLFMYYIHRKQLVGHDLAEHNTLELNKRYPQPLKEAEVKVSIKVNTKYRYSNKAFYEALGVTKDQVSKLNKPSNHARDIKRKSKREERANYIKELLASDKTYKEIAEVLGCSVETVKRNAKKYNMQRNYIAGAK